MPEQKVLALAELPTGSKKTIKIGETEILLVHTEDGLYAVESKCPHAGAPLEKGAVCDGRIVCPWHMSVFTLSGGEWMEPPALRSLKTYSVRVDGDAILVDPLPVTEPTLAGAPFSSDAPADTRHFVFLGAGAATASAVCTLRQHGFTGKLTLVDPVADEPVDRPNLSKQALAGKMPVEKLPLWTDEDCAHLGLDRVKVKASALDIDRRVLTTEGGRTIPYDAALVATGGTPVQLGIPGEDLAHVHTLRHLADMQVIVKQAPEGARVAIIGDSFIALEAASALTTRGLKVTVIARAELPFAKRFGAEPAKALLALHESKGVTLKYPAEAKAIHQEAVLLKDGSACAADLVIVAIGVKPATGFAHSLPLEENQSVKVGRDLKAAPEVWAAGDVATVDGVHIEHWRLAQQHGRVAGLGMLAHGASSPAPVFEGVPFFWTTHFGKRLGYVGHADTYDSLIIDGELEQFEFLAYYVKDRKVAAVLGCGRDSALAMLAEKMRSSLMLEQARTAAKH